MGGFLCLGGLHGRISVQRGKHDQGTEAWGEGGARETELGVKLGLMDLCRSQESPADLSLPAPCVLSP